MIAPGPGQARAPSGPRGHWLLGSFRHFRRDSLAFLERCARDHGDVVPLRMAHRRAVILNHPATIEEVLVHRHRSFIKHFALRLARPVVGDGLLTSEGDSWVAHRRLAQPAFRAERIAAYAPIMAGHAARMLARWPAGQAFDLHEEMMALTSGIVTACLFGSEIHAGAGEISAAMEALMVTFKERLDALVPIPRFLPTARNRRFRRALARVEGMLRGMIAERRAADSDAGDLLGALLRAHRQEGGAALSDLQLRDEMMTLFVAGHETTANALSWTFWQLARHPEPEARLQQELDRELGGRAPSPADLARLPFLGHVIDESMRLMPPAWIIGREAIEPCEIAGLRIARGTTMLMSQWVVHRDARWFPDPGAFRPERWEGGLAERIPRFAYFPFGGGPRMCIGAGFARMELALLIAAIAARFRLRLAPDARVAPFATITLRPRHGMRMIAEARA